MIGQLQLAFYKGSKGRWGAAQLQLQKPHFYCKTCKTKNFTHRGQAESCKQKGCDPVLASREGCVFVDITSAKPDDTYDWDNKICIALSIYDIGKILIVLENTVILKQGEPGPECSILHDPGANSNARGKIMKTLKISSPKGVTTAGVILQATQKTTGQDTKVHTVPLSPSEAKILTVALRSAVSAAIGW